MTDFGGQPLPPELEGFHPVLAQWFFRSFGEPTPVQREDWDAIRTGHHALNSGPDRCREDAGGAPACLDHCIRTKTGPGAGFPA